MTEKQPTWLEIENQLLREMLHTERLMTQTLREQIDMVIKEARVLAHRLGQDVEEYI